MNIDIFRAYDIRGKYPSEISDETAYIIGKSYGSYLQEKYQKNTCIVSWDNRLSSPSLSNQLQKGILESGCNVISLGLTTTPMNYYGRYLKQLPGIMVTASHNPKDENGFKFSFDGMINARGDMIEDFKAYTLKNTFLNGTGVLTEENISDKYLEYLKYSRAWGKNKRKIVIDCGNGATTSIARKVFSNMYCDFVIINEENDGNFPNHHPDPAVEENLSALKKKVLEEKADFGVAYDGDGDRIGIVDEKGNALPIEYFMILMIRSIAPTVRNKKFLYDIKCSKCLEDEINKIGAEGIMYRTGASYTQHAVREQNLPFGGEYSGHIYFRDKDADCGSALYATLRLLEVLSKTSEPVSELCKDIPKYVATEEIKIPSTDELKFQVVEKVKEFATKEQYVYNDIDGVRITFSNGWALIRASNTGKNITFRAEAETEEGLNMLKEIFLTQIDIHNRI